jgi:FtsZ-binding cell division protein ZapB
MQRQSEVRMPFPNPKFYSDRKLVRYGKSFIPPKYNTQLAIGKMKVAINAMSEETTLLLHMRVREIQSDNKTLQQKVEDMNQRLRGIKSRPNLPKLRGYC